MRDRRHEKARKVVDDTALSPKIIRKIVLSIFHRKHDYGGEDLSALVTELGNFGIETVKMFRLLMLKHRKAIREDEERKMPRAEVLYFADEMSWEGLDKHTGRSWFTILGLVRQVMELEFGEQASIYASAYGEECPDRKGTKCS